MRGDDGVGSRAGRGGEGGWAQKPLEGVMGLKKQFDPKVKESLGVVPGIPVRRRPRL